jgi:HEPN domain-containing protein
MSELEVSRWLRAAENDLAMARALREDQFYDGCAFHAQQAAEKALKGLLYALHLRPWGHSCFLLLQQISEILPADSVTPLLVEASHRLDEHYLPSRYPDALPEGIPAEQYDSDLADEALYNAGQILEFVRRRLP